MVGHGFTDRYRMLAAAHHFRSAAVEELALNDDFFRRPLRAEDLDFLSFDHPVTSRDIDALSSLMSQRTLLSLNEMDEPMLPAGTDAAALAEWRSFYDAGVREAGRGILAEMEEHAFHFLNDAPAGPLGGILADAITAADRFWRERRQCLERADYLREGLGFVLVQTVPLWKSALGARVAALPCLAEVRDAGPAGEALQSLDAMAQGLGLRTGRHSYWQFYQPASLAAANLLLRLGRSPLTVAEYAGARLLFEADRVRLCGIICPDAGDPAAAGDALQAQAVAVPGVLRAAIGREADEAVARGAAWMAHLLRLARTSLAAQLTWISDPAQAQRAAAQIHEKILRDAPDIDRDTFVEPRDMCSTMHVHDDDRLVVIESGEMVFWGNTGMRHRMGPGDMILVPRGRLHGSTVLSESCTYHQPIIPENWRPAIPAWSAAAP